MGPQNVQYASGKESVRLTGDWRQIATNELLSLLEQHPDGLRTSELTGTPKFHGSRTLSSHQIIRLLRESGKVTEHFGGQGIRTFSYWTLNK